MSFLEKLSKLKKTTIPSTTKNNNESAKKNVNKAAKDVLESESSLLPKSYTREEDPAVKRLKELRRKEQLKKGTLQTKKPSVSRKRLDDTVTEARFKRKVSSSTVTRKTMPVNRQPIKKLSFDELMKQAEQKSKNPPLSPSPLPKNEKKKDVKPAGLSSKIRKNGFKLPHQKRPVTNAKKNVPVSKKEVPVKIALPKNNIAQPSEKLRKRLEMKQQHRKRYYGGEDEDEDDMDDFIDDDDDEEAEYVKDHGYDRDEIWAMFNKGKRRSDYLDYDEDADDMEANEVEILQEEERASKMARLEDKREEKWLKMHEEEKSRRRLGKK